jgi:hypothetical protein
MVNFIRNLQSAHIAIEIVGWAGVGLIILAYGLLSFDLLDNHSGIYQIMNLLGSVGIVINSLVKKDYQPAALNIVWATIAIFALLSLAA